MYTSRRTDTLTHRGYSRAAQALEKDQGSEHNECACQSWRRLLNIPVRFPATCDASTTLKCPSKRNHLLCNVDHAWLPLDLPMIWMP